MISGNVARVVVVLGAAVALIGSASNNQNQNQSMQTAQFAQSGGSPPPPQEMEPARALGLWRSTFGAVKIEADNSRGGVESGSLQGVWVYQRQGQEVVGYFSGNLKGNVLEFKWQEPNNPPLTGSGYLVFDRSGRQYSGRWWSDRRDRVGDWNGWRNQPGTNDAFNRQPNPNGDPYADPNNTDGGAYGNQGYGGPQQDQGNYPQPPPRRQPPRRQPQPQPQPGQYGPQPQPTQPNYY
jgi:hypothetical protein